MKKSGKLGMGLLAGALLAATLTACGAGEGGNLPAPEAFQEAIMSDRDMTIVQYTREWSDGGEETRTVTYTRDGGKVMRHSVSSYSENYSYNDLDNGISYSNSFDTGELEAYERSYTQWSKYVASGVFEYDINFLFDSENYQKKGGRYVMTDEAALEMLETIKTNTEFVYNYGEWPCLK